LGELFFSILFAIGTICIGIGVVTYIVPEFGVEGKMYYITIVFIAFLLLAWRIIFRAYLSNYAPARNVLIVGTGKVAGMLADEIRERRNLGFRFAGFAGPSPPGNDDAGGPNYLGEYGKIEEIVRQHNVHEIVVAIADRRGLYPVKEMLELRVTGKRIIEWPSFFEKLSGRIPVDSLAPSFFIFSEGFRKSAVILWVRRVISFLVAVVGLIFLAPVFLVVSLFIAVDSPGRIFYLQERVGFNGKRIQLIKFRSMIENAEAESGPRWATEMDPRITRVGRILRKFRIDEIPQFLNVLKGDLDIVGPRPERPVFVRKLEESIPYYALRHSVRPGVTGWAQIMFTYCGTIEESREKLQYDLFYVKNMSIKLDLMILVRTIKILILGRGAR
jgi:sugar transferase (PEP-CTERM system associated)